MTARPRGVTIAGTMVIAQAALLGMAAVAVAVLGWAILGDRSPGGYLAADPGSITAVLVVIAAVLLAFAAFVMFLGVMVLRLRSWARIVVLVLEMLAIANAAFGLLFAGLSLVLSLISVRGTPTAPLLPAAQVLLQVLYLSYCGAICYLLLHGEGAAAFSARSPSVVGTEHLMPPPVGPSQNNR